MAKLTTLVALPNVEEVLSGRSTWEKFWRDLTSAIVYYFQKIIARLNDEVVGNTGYQSIDGELYISQKFGVGTTTRLIRMSSGVINIAAGTVPGGGGQVEVTLSFAGAQLKDEVVATPDNGIEPNLIWNAYVSSPGNVKIRIINPTTAAIATAARDWRVTVRRYA